jgi:hypothetical protein
VEPIEGFEDFVRARMPSLYRFGYALSGSRTTRRIWYRRR